VKTLSPVPGVRGMTRIRLALVVAALLVVPVAAAVVPAGAPEDVGLSSERLKRITETVQRYIDGNDISGAVTIVARQGRVAHFEAQGLMDIESRKPMRKDAVFPIASMSKPVTGVAILMLVEQGKIRLSDPVSRFIPEFKDTKVAMLRSDRPAPRALPGQPPPAPDIYTVPASRAITIRDLMTHTSGLLSGGPGAREGARIAPRRATDSLAAHIPQLGAAPLDFQPGSRWSYSALAGIDTLGRVVEVASGKTFDQFLKQHVFDPLGMKDTTFVPAQAQMPRVVTLYRRGPKGLERIDTPEWLDTRTMFSGGGGLWSTAEDYLQFAQMLCNGGELNGTRLLSPRTVDLMAANHVGDLFAEAGSTGGRPGMGFGLTVDVVLDAVEAGVRRSTGSFGWGGAFGTNFWVDRKERLVGVLMIQTPVGALRGDFENAVMQAVVD
jgi:CubicO group peptidase (beta-lactamase class C family)